MSQASCHIIVLIVVKTHALHFKVSMGLKPKLPTIIRVSGVHVDAPNKKFRIPSNNLSQRKWVLLHELYDALTTCGCAAHAIEV